MEDTKTQIARNLDMQFAEMGFAVPGVDALREKADVSLRTLYKYYPSREAMVVGALEYRDQAYDAWIGSGPDMGADHVLHIFERLADWLAQVRNTGCLFLNAMAAYPDSVPIRTAVEAHKTGLRMKFRNRLLHVSPDCDADALAHQMVILHEGMTETARLVGPDMARRHGLTAARLILSAANIHCHSKGT